MKFDLEERETLINFFNSNPALWNHHLTKYRDWNLRDSLLEKLVEKFRGKFNKDDIKREWHNYKQYTGEKNQVQKSQTQVLVMYIALHGNILAKWNLLMLSVILMPHTFLDRAYTPPVRKKRKHSRTAEDDAKIELRKSLAASLKSQDNINAKSESFKRATLSGKVVADSLLQHDPKEWCYLKKKVTDVFYDHKKHKSNTHYTYPNNPSYLANQFVQENNFQSAHFMNMVSNVSNNGMPMNQSSHKKIATSQNNEFDPFSPVSTCSNDSY